MHGPLKRRAQALRKRCGGKELSGFNEVGPQPLLGNAHRIMLPFKRYELDAELRAWMQGRRSGNGHLHDHPRPYFGTDAASYLIPFGMQLSTDRTGQRDGFLFTPRIMYING